MKRLPFSKKAVIDVYLKSGQTVRIKCGSFNTEMTGDRVTKWEIEGKSPYDYIWFVPNQIAAFQLVRRTWW